jgi:hypothetical protein
MELEVLLSYSHEHAADHYPGLDESSPLGF